MPWTPTNEQPSSTPKMYTSRLAFNCYAAARPMDFLYRPALHCLKMFILKLIKRLVQLVLQVLNGAIQLPSLHHQDHQRAHLQMAGVVAWPRSTHRLIRQIRMTSGNQLVAPDRFLLHHALQALGKSSK